jgi:hypothetical protein
VNGNFGTFPLEKGGPLENLAAEDLAAEDLAAYLALSRVANSKGYCPFGAAVATSIS